MRRCSSEVTRLENNRVCERFGEQRTHVRVHESSIYIACCMNMCMCWRKIRNNSCGAYGFMARLFGPHTHDMHNKHITNEQQVMM